MMSIAWEWLKGNWERLLFALIGFSCLFFGFKFLIDEAIASASAVFAISFFSFLYSNLARFKRFKGLGFEAELWEDKQKEAADLIDRLKNIVSIYTRQIVMNSVMRGRWDDGDDWETRWTLYGELVNQHDALGQKIDFSDLKRKLDGIFIFDMCGPLVTAVRHAIDKSRTEARKKIDSEFGSPIRDAKGYGERHEQLREVAFEAENLFHRAEFENIAQDILNQANAANETMLRNFSISIEYDPVVLQKLERIAQLQRPLQIDEQLIALTNRTESNH